MTFLEAIRNAGLTPPSDLISDGTIHRFTTDGDKPRSNNCWYVLHNDGDFSAGSFGSWKSDISHTWCNKSVKVMGADEKKQYRVKMDAIKAQREAESELVAEQCRSWCLNAWNKSIEANTSHPYLARKGINSHGVRQYKDALIIPVRSISGVIHGIQFISPDGTKKFKTGTRPTGFFYPIGSGTNKTLVICEGFATGASIHEATGYDVAVAFSAGNIKAVANDLRAALDDKHIIIAADNDQWTTGNPGLTKATEAAKLIGATLVYPDFPPDGEGHPVDFNDLHQSDSLDAVKAVFSEVDSLLVDIVDFHLTAPQYLIDGMIETPGTGMLVGASGSGKSFIVIDWALCVAYGKEWCGKTVKQGPVIYICGEGKHGIPRRVAAWHHKYGIAKERGRFHLTKVSLELDDTGARKLSRSIDKVAELYGTPPLLVIDTFARALPSGADENSVKDVQPWIHLVDSIRDKYACTALIVHHTGHAEIAKGRGRGSSALKAAMDFEVLARIVNAEEKIGSLECTKAKDMEPWQPIQYTLCQVDVAPDIGSAVPHYEFDNINGSVECCPESLSALKQAIIDEGTTAYSCHVDTWKKHFYGPRPNGADDKSRQQFTRDKKKMLKNSVIKIHDDIVTVIDENVKEIVKIHIFRRKLEGASRKFDFLDK